jgi:hypothetical protein
MTKNLTAVLLLGAAMVNAQDSQRDAAVSLARKTLCAKLGVSSEAVKLDKAEAVDWADASLGCPEKGMMYAQMLTPGYKISLTVDGKTHDVHVAGTRAVMCKDARKPARTETKK